MIIGILSDSHGRHLAVRKAVELLDGLGASHLIHCGDVGGAEVFDELLGRPLSFVWGNMDDPDPSLLTYLRSVGVRPPDEPPVRLHLDGKSLAVFHGHEPGFARAVSDLDVQVLLHGHTHAARDECYNGKRIINPGALFRANRKTVATLDTQTDAVAFHEIKGV